MKIAYDNNGNIEATALDDQPISGTNIIQLPDNIDVFQNPFKWLYVNNSFIRRPYLILTPSVDTSVINNPVTVTIQAYNSDGSANTTASDIIELKNQDGILSATNVQLVNGQASFTVNSDRALIVFIAGTNSNYYSEPIKITFTNG